MNLLCKLFGHLSEPVDTILPRPGERMKCRRCGYVWIWGAPAAPKAQPENPVMTFDPRTEKNLATLLPKAQAAARAFLLSATAAMKPRGITVRIISGTRTHAEQDALYEQGRTKPGPIVTNARGGQSNHNHGIAWDIGLFIGSRYLEESPYYAECGRIGERQGLEWGGSWARPDEPHFQLRKEAR